MSGGEEPWVKEPLSHPSLSVEQQPWSQRPTRLRHRKMSQNGQDDCDCGAGGGPETGLSQFWATEILFYYCYCGLTGPLPKDKDQTSPSKYPILWSLLHKLQWAAPGRKLDPAIGGMKVVRGELCLSPPGVAREQPSSSVAFYVLKIRTYLKGIWEILGWWLQGFPQKDSKEPKASRASVLSLRTLEWSLHELQLTSAAGEVCRT